VSSVKCILTLQQDCETAACSSSKPHIFCVWQKCASEQFGCCLYTACCLLQAVFAEVYELDVDEDVNKVLFALLQPLQEKPGTHQSKGNSRTHKKGKSVTMRAKVSGLYQISFPVDGSASAVRLLTPRLQSIVQKTSMQRLSELQAMLQNLSLIK